MNLEGQAVRGVAGFRALVGNAHAVGEQPGDREDLAGHPFVGPAGGVRKSWPLVEAESPPSAGVRASLANARRSGPSQCPSRFRQACALADQGTREAVSRTVGLPPVQILRVDATVIDTVRPSRARRRCGRP